MSTGPVRWLLLGVLLLAAGLAGLWFDSHGQWRNLAWEAPRALPPELKLPASALQPDATAGNAARFAAILERPLFAPDRRPPPPPPPPAAELPPDPLANIQIQGIFSGANAGILARVDGKTRRIKVNETVGRWTLKSIDGRDVTFGQGGEKRKLSLAYAPLGAVLKQAAASAVAAPPGTPPGTPRGTAPAGAPGAAVLPQNVQDAERERLRRRNEIRAARGLPLLTE